MNSAIDRNGNTVKAGDRVVVLSVDQSVLSPLPLDEREKVISMIGMSLRVYEIDSYCQAWVEMKWDIAPGEVESHSLGLVSAEMELVLS